MTIPNTTSPFIVIKESAIHGSGIFAAQAIPKGTRIIEYVGEKISKDEAGDRVTASINDNKEDQSKGAVYIFELNDTYDIDGDVPYNTARHINHSCDPNAETEIISDQIWIIAIRNIAQGEEIFYNYGYDFEDFEEHPCFCGTSRCVGYILGEEHWPKLKEHNEKLSKMLG